MQTVEKLVALSDGNPGAATFLKGLLQDPSTPSPTADEIIDKIEASKMRGWNLWVVFSDICGKDNNKVIQLFKNAPIEKIEEYSQKQDYSGREALAEYIQD